MIGMTQRDKERLDQYLTQAPEDEDESPVWDGTDGEEAVARIDAEWERVNDKYGDPDDYEQDEQVADCFACPVCGNAEMDTLEWDRDGEAVTCTKCNTTYDPNA